MALIPTTTHSVIDYAAGLALLALPVVLGLPVSGATATLQLAGLATLVLSLMTAYRLSVLKLVPFRLHLMLDAALGLMMLVGGWLTFADGTAALLLLAAGIIYLLVPALSWPRTERGGTVAPRPPINP